ncbi:MAG: sensor histidine kinase [Hyphomicrobiales bacterium]|jgi:signal transduction histidine kinase|nr:sensor histidine kinase [Hyphomicrobiales bacterium]MBP9173026.1 sensor histidine kinase [Hyphomicrobiales bacterium]MCC7481804.1 sensor histidine kinase [Hyphomicrobiales bacterium]
MQSNSLSFRLIFTSAVVAVVLLVTAAFLLAYLFQQALERNFDARLRAILDGLLANVELATDGSPVMSGKISDPRFTIPLSGWYWQVSPPSHRTLPDLASESALEQRLTPTGVDLQTRGSDGVASFYIKDSNGQQLRAIEQKFKLFGGEEFSFLVAGNFDELKAEVTAFQRALYAVLTLLGLGLLLAIFLQVRVAMQPMQRMQQSLAAIRAGKAERLEGEFPHEMQPVADELNLLILAGTEIIDRARTQVGNLAHALKTPLSVLSNEAQGNKSDFGAKVTEQIQIMRDHVSLYLDRARRAARAQTLGAATDVEPVLAALGRTIMRINKDRGVTIEVTVTPGLKFRGEVQDLEEMAGNLIDNAAKWSRQAVKISAAPVIDPIDGTQNWLMITVDDDGPGIAASKRAEAVKRGKRLDETKPGSGLGLSIVTETAGMYSGNLVLGDAPLGGLRVQLRLPAVA